jgi:hypothetical protein
VIALAIRRTLASRPLAGHRRAGVRPAVEPPPDEGLGDIRRFPPRRYAGIVLIKLEQKGRRAVRHAVLTLLPQIPAKGLADRLVVMTHSSLRLR